MIRCICTHCQKQVQLKSPCPGCGFELEREPPELKVGDIVEHELWDGVFRVTAVHSKWQIEAVEVDAKDGTRCYLHANKCTIKERQAGEYGAERTQGPTESSNPM